MPAPHPVQGRRRRRFDMLLMLKILVTELGINVG
jgi:hypothetical protein